MIITIDIMKKINNSIASAKYMSLSDMAKECYLDEKLLESVVGELDKPLTSMRAFFSMIEEYITATQKRVKMLNECYNAIQRAQIDSGAIAADVQDPPILW
jgi:hypothetical protein